MKNDMQDIYVVVRDQVTEMKIDFKVKTKLLEKLEDMFVNDADTNAYMRFTTLAKMYESTFVSEKERFLLNKSLCGPTIPKNIMWTKKTKRRLRSRTLNHKSGISEP